VEFVDLMRERGVSVVTVDQNCKLKPVNSRKEVEKVMARNGNAKCVRFDVDDPIFKVRATRKSYE
jgi:hypothetical protein